MRVFRYQNSKRTPNHLEYCEATTKRLSSSKAQPKKNFNIGSPLKKYNSMGTGHQHYSNLTNAQRRKKWLCRTN
ncbi:unnamed protein product [Caenorhabditis nigoni]